MRLAFMDNDWFWLLDPDDVIQRGDKVYRGDLALWTPVSSYRVGSRKAGSKAHYRRDLSDLERVAMGKE